MTFTKTLRLQSKRQFEIIDITRHVEEVVVASKISTGLVTIYVPHTTAAVRLNHLEPLLLQDLMKIMYRLVPVESNYAHDFFEIRTQGNALERSNGHAHVKAFLLGASESIPLLQGQLLLGARQSIFFVELDGPRERQCHVSIVGE